MDSDFSRCQFVCGTQRLPELAERLHRLWRLLISMAFEGIETLYTIHPLGLLQLSPSINRSLLQSPLQAMFSLELFPSLLLPFPQLWNSLLSHVLGITDSSPLVWEFRLGFTLSLVKKLALRQGLVWHQRGHLSPFLPGWTLVTKAISDSKLHSPWLAGGPGPGLQAQRGIKGQVSCLLG